MTTPNQTYSWVLTGSASATTLLITQPIQNTTDVYAFLTDNTGYSYPNLNNGTDYIVQNVGQSNPQIYYNPSTGALPSGWTLTAILNANLLSSNSYTNTNGYDASSVQSGMDYMSLGLITLYGMIKQTQTSVAGGGVLSVNGNTGAVTITPANISAAPINSPTFNGVPSAPTATAGTNTTQIATTGFVQAALSVIPTDYSLGFKNRIFNGNFDIWQRGTSFGNSNGYSADRWYADRASASNNLTASRVAVTNIIGATYGVKLLRTASDTQTTAIRLSQSIDVMDSYPFLGQNANLSFWVKSGANFSGANAMIQICYGDGSNANVITTTGWNFSTAYNFVPTTSFQQIRYTIAIPSTAKQVAIMISYAPTGTAGADDSFTVAQVDLRAGNPMTNYEFRPSQVELALCQRFYWQVGGVNLFDLLTPVGVAVSTSFFNFVITPPVAMRSLPTVNITNVSSTILSGGNTTTPSNFGVVGTEGNGVQFSIYTGVTGATVGSAAFLRANNSATTVLSYSAEL